MSLQYKNDHPLRMLDQAHAFVSFLKWFPKTFHLHGIHSPFIYEFEKKGLRKRVPRTVATDLKRYHTTVRNTAKKIKVEDYGAGSRVFRDTYREVGAIARYAGASLARMHLLYNLTEYFKPTRILELGTSVGLGTAALAYRKEGHITTVEGCPQTAAIAQHYFTLEHFKNINSIVSRFEDMMPDLKKEKYDLIYFDGNHSKKATLDYVRQLLPTVHNDTVWIFDDIHWSKSMTVAWQQIQLLPEVTATIDGFSFGIVFFRKEQRKEEFQIRL